MFGQSGAGRPHGFQLIRSLNGLPRLLSDNADEILFDDDLHDTGEVFY